MNKVIGLTALIIAALGLSVSCKNKTPEQRAQFVMRKIERKLDLNEKQKEKLEKVKDRMLVIYKQKKSNKEDFHKDVKKLLIQDKMSEVEVKSLLDRKRNHIDTLLPEVLPEIIDFHASLDLEQKEKLVKFIDKLSKRRRGKTHQ